MGSVFVGVGDWIGGCGWVGVVRLLSGDVGSCVGCDLSVVVGLIGDGAGGRLGLSSVASSSSFSRGGGVYVHGGDSLGGGSGGVVYVRSGSGGGGSGVVDVGSGGVYVADAVSGSVLLGSGDSSGGGDRKSTRLNSSH